VALVPAGVGGDPDNWLIVRKRERTSEQPHGGSSREPSVPSEIRRGKRIVRLSNLDKLFWPEQGITKGDLLRYYSDVAPTLLPHIRDRPFTMKRYPDGWDGKPFFRKDATNYAPAWIKRVAVRVTSRGPTDDRSPGRKRRSRLALDGQHGLYRVPHLVLAHRQARSAGLGRLRP
jgi:LigD, primase-polymerase domain